MNTKHVKWIGVSLVQLTALSFAGALYAQSQPPLVIWKKPGASARIVVTGSKQVPPGVLVVTYRLFVVNSAAQTPEMAVASLSAICDPQSNKPVKVFSDNTTTMKYVGGKFVEDSNQPHTPPIAIPFESDYDFGEAPAAACALGGAGLVR